MCRGLSFPERFRDTDGFDRWSMAERVDFTTKVKAWLALCTVYMDDADAEWFRKKLPEWVTIEASASGFGKLGTGLIRIFIRDDFENPRELLYSLMLSNREGGDRLSRLTTSLPDSWVDPREWRLQDV